MSQFLPALNFVLDNEDAKREYANVPDYPPGAHSISGVNSAAYPTQYAEILTIPQPQRGPSISNFYETVFWRPSGAEGIMLQDIANRVLDQSVNGGLKTGPTLLQIASIHCGASLVVDGNIGPQTLGVVNSLNPDELLEAFKTARINHYRSIAARNPSEAKYLPVWVARASK